MSVQNYEHDFQRHHLRELEEEDDHDNLLPYLGTAELKEVATLLKAVTAEFVGTCLLVLVGCGSCIGGDRTDSNQSIDDQANIVRISLCFGITVATLAQTLGHVSGCNINPAVTLGLVLGGKLGILKGLLYVAAQCGGALLGSLMLYAVVPSAARGAAGLGKTGLAPDVTFVQALTIEMLITMVLVMVVFAAAADSGNSSNVKGSAPLAIGLSITTCHLFAVPFTGSSMNPARSLGPAVILGEVEHLWVYWAGPLLGGIFGALLYQVVLRSGVETSRKLRKRYPEEQAWRNRELRHHESNFGVLKEEPWARRTDRDSSYPNPDILRR